jgi:hypothetical protein
MKATLSGTQLSVAMTPAFFKGTSANPNNPVTGAWTCTLIPSGSVGIWQNGSLSPQFTLVNSGNFDLRAISEGVDELQIIWNFKRQDGAQYSMKTWMRLRVVDSSEAP